MGRTRFIHGGWLHVRPLEQPDRSRWMRVFGWLRGDRGRFGRLW